MSNLNLSLTLIFLSMEKMNQQLSQPESHDFSPEERALLDEEISNRPPLKMSLIYRLNRKKKEERKTHESIIR